MPALVNQRWENFAQGVHAGTPPTDAYIAAGFEVKSRAGATRSARRLLETPEVEERVKELNAVTAEKNGLTADRVIAELMAIGFADIRKVIEWRGCLTRVKDQEEGGDVLVIKEVFHNHVRLIDSDTLSAATASAVKKVSQSPTGGLTIEMHDKQAALVKLGEYLGIFDGRGASPDAPMGQFVDSPPRETLEEWIARRGRTLNADPTRSH